MAFKRIIQTISGPVDGGDGVMVQDMYQTIEVVKDSKQALNTAHVRIYNLSENTAQKMCPKGNRLIISVGYEDESLSSLFYGTIVYAYTVKDGADHYLDIEASDGQITAVSKTAVLSYAAGTSFNQIVSDIVNILAIPVIGLQLLPAGITYSTGYVFPGGKALDALTEVLKRAGLTWTIQNEQLYILYHGDSTLGGNIVLAAGSGLLRSPERIMDTTDKMPGATSRNRWKVTALMFPQIVPGARVTLKSSAVEGTFTVEKASFSGDNRDGDFQVVAEMSDLPAGAPANYSDDPSDSEEG